MVTRVSNDRKALTSLMSVHRVVAGSLGTALVASAAFGKHPLDDLNDISLEHIYSFTTASNDDVAGIAFEPEGSQVIVIFLDDDAYTDGIGTFHEDSYQCLQELDWVVVTNCLFQQLMFFIGNDGFGGIHGSASQHTSALVLVVGRGLGVTFGRVAGQPQTEHTQQKYDAQCDVLLLNLHGSVPGV